jgi:RsiW-degrading membrane proteinase PrsW (M82 family)
MTDPESGAEPVDTAADEDRDLYDVATWEPRSTIDRVAVTLHDALASNAQLFVVLLAVLVFLAQLGGVLWLLSQNTGLGVVALLSALPAFGLVLVVWTRDIVETEPLDTLAITFVLAVLFASFAATVNTVLGGLFRSIPLVGMALFFYIVVAPVEETVKWLAVRLYAVRRSEFDAVIDGAVYGAVAGLGFATIENVLYVVQGFLQAQADGGGAQALQAAVGTGVSRALAGPGHVIYSAWAGYYLGLAKYNPENRGPIVVKGLLIASLIHGTYNVIVTYLPRGISSGAFILFVLLFDGFFFYLLYRKLARYRDVYRDVVETAEGAGGADGWGDADATEEPAEPEGDEPTTGGQRDEPAADEGGDDEPTEQ